ncbi:hypothetical protein, partial [Methylomonas fluvii]
ESRLLENIAWLVERCPQQRHSGQKAFAAGDASSNLGPRFEKRHSAYCPFDGSGAVGPRRMGDVLRDAVAL